MEIVRHGNNSMRCSGRNNNSGLEAEQLGLSRRLTSVRAEPGAQCQSVARRQQGKRLPRGTSLSTRDSTQGNIKKKLNFPKGTTV